MGLLGIDPICSIYPKPNFTLLPETRNLDVINCIFYMVDQLSYSTH